MRSSTENLPRCNIGKRRDRRGKVLIDAHLNEAVEDRPFNARLIMIDVVAEIKSRLGRENAGVDIREALNPWIGAKLGGAGGSVEESGAG